MSKPLLIVLAGPTAVGKTELCVRLARELDTEIVSADSRQFYRELSIGTAKPTPEEQQGIPHHFVDSHSIADYFSVGDFEKEALSTLAEIFSRKQVAILTGGSGLFLKVVTDGLDDMPEVNLEIRETLMERFRAEGMLPLTAELQRLDPAYFEQVDRHNTQRVIRALEVCLSSGKPYSSFRSGQKAERPFDVVKIALTRDREVLYNRINLRVDQMIAAGLVAEVRSVAAYRDHYALRTVGYQEVFAYFDGELTEAEMIARIQQNTRRYAKRQLTWFRHQGGYVWFDAEKYGEVLAYVREYQQNREEKSGQKNGKYPIK